MADRWNTGNAGWDPNEAKRLKKELRDEAMRLRDEFTSEWQRQMAEQMEEMRGQRGPARGPRRGAPRGGREPLSRERIVDQAMKIMEDEGFDKVTMRKVAWGLDTGPASIYAHVQSMSELHGHMLNRMLASLELEDSEGTWRERVARLLDRYRLHLLANPGLARSAVTARPSGHHYLALVERLLALLDEGGVPMSQASWGVDLLLLWATSSAAEHAKDEDQEAAESREGEWEALRTAVEHADRYPHISALGLDLVGGDGQSRSQWAIDALLAGIASTPRD